MLKIDALVLISIPLKSIYFVCKFEQTFFEMFAFFLLKSKNVCSSFQSNYFTYKIEQTFLSVSKHFANNFKNVCSLFCRYDGPSRALSKKSKQFLTYLAEKNIEGKKREYTHIHEIIK